MFKIRVFVILIFATYKVIAGNDNSPTGARFAGIGNAAVSLSDLWSVQHNQAGLAYIKNIQAGIYYENRFLIKELGLKSSALAIPLKAGTIGLNISSFGYSSYSENKYGLSFAKAFGENISAGVQLDYLTTNIAEGYGKKNAIAGEAGVQARLVKGLTIGMHIFNPTRTRLAKYDDERIPTILRLGLDYKFSQKLIVAIETEKDINYKAVFKAGLEYLPIKELYLRAGISTNPALSSFGFGLNLKQFKLDIAASYHSVLGVSPQVGLKYEFE